MPFKVPPSVLIRKRGFILRALYGPEGVTAQQIALNWTSANNLAVQMIAETGGVLPLMVLLTGGEESS